MIPAITLLAIGLLPFSVIALAIPVALLLAALAGALIASMLGVFAVVVALLCGCAVFAGLGEPASRHRWARAKA